jgi:hypothetical protein
MAGTARPRCRATTRSSEISAPKKPAHIKAPCQATAAPAVGPPCAGGSTPSRTRPPPRAASSVAMASTSTPTSSPRARGR